MTDTITRVPAFAPYLERNKDELFETSNTIRSKEIDKLLTESVDHWIADNIDEATRITKDAEKYTMMTDDEFATEYANSEGE